MMLKHIAGFRRPWTAHAAWLIALALTPLSASNAQVASIVQASDGASAATSNANPSTVVQESADERLRAVESQLRELLAAEAARTDAAAKEPSFDLGGQVQVDYLFIGQNAANRASVGEAEDVFDFRRARLTGRGEAFDVVEYAIGFDFALPGRPSFLDNYIAVRDLPVLGHVRVGHFFEPFSIERITQNRYNTFSERNLADAFAPARNLGMMSYDTVGEDQRGTLAVGWFRSNSGNFGDEFSSGTGWALTTRATWLPYYDEVDGRTFLHLGAAYSYRSATDRVVQFLSFPEARAGTPGLRGIPPFVDTGVIAAQSDQRFGTEIALVRGPLYLQGEYIATTVDQIGGPSLFFQGAYGFVSYFLTGENRTYNKQLGTIDRVYPYENFFRVRTSDGVQTGRGAWEASARVSYIDLTSHNIQGGRLTDYTLSLTWHLNPYTRVRWEYIYAHLDRAPVGESFAQIAGMRFDMDF